MDGLYYANIARNMAEGQGSFWAPFFSPQQPYFHGHPPLAFALQSLFFSAIGDYFWVDRLYPYSLLLAHLLLFGAFARRLQVVSGAWLGLLSLGIPLWSWAFQENILELSLSFFALAAVYLLWAYPLLWYSSLLAGFLLLAALLSKGLPALFVLGLPLWAWYCLEDRSWRQTLGQTLVLGLVGPGSLMLAYFAWPSAGQFLEDYVHTQLYASLSGQHMAHTQRWYLLAALVEELLPLLIFGLLLASQAKQKLGRMSLFFLGLGLMASLPLLVSPKQLRFYLFPSLPYFVLAMGCYTAGAEAVLRRWLGQQSIVYAALLGLVLLLSTWRIAQVWGRPLRDVELLPLLAQMAAKPQGLCLGGSLAEEWQVEAYLYRYWKLHFPRCPKDDSPGLHKKDGHYVLYMRD